MASKKCAPGCICGRHKPHHDVRAIGKKCPPDCRCKRHVASGNFKHKPIWMSTLGRKGNL